MVNIRNYSCVLRSILHIAVKPRLLLLVLQQEEEPPRGHKGRLLMKRLPSDLPNLRQLLVSDWILWALSAAEEGSRLSGIRPLVSTLR